MNRMGDKFNKLGKDIRQAKTQKNNKKETNKEQPEDQQGEDNNQNQANSGISSIK